MQYIYLAREAIIPANDMLWKRKSESRFTHWSQHQRSEEALLNFVSSIYIAWVHGGFAALLESSNFICFQKVSECSLCRVYSLQELPCCNRKSGGKKIVNVWTCKNHCFVDPYRITQQKSKSIKNFEHERSLFDGRKWWWKSPKQKIFDWTINRTQKLIQYRKTLKYL